MKTKFQLTAVGIALTMLVAACSAGYSESSQSEAIVAPDSASPAPANHSLAAGVPGLNSPERKLIHTAGMEAEVTDLYEASSRIETATLQLGGQVTNSAIRKELQETRDEPSGGDSLFRMRRYRGEAILALRVPVSRLNSLLRVIAAQTRFIETRQVQIDDATYRYLAAEQRNKEQMPAGERIPGVANTDALEARRYLDSKRDETIDRQVGNLQTADAAAFASLAIRLWQPEEIVLDSRPDLSRILLPGAGIRLQQSLRNGWDMLYAVLLGLLQIWPLAILIAAGAILARRWCRRTTSLQSRRP